MAPVTSNRGFPDAGNIINQYFSTSKGMSLTQALTLHGAKSKIRVWGLALKLVTKP